MIKHTFRTVNALLLAAALIVGGLGISVLVSNSEVNAQTTCSSADQLAGACGTPCSSADQLAGKCTSGTGTTAGGAVTQTKAAYCNVGTPLGAFFLLCSDPQIAPLLKAAGKTANDVKSGCFNITADGQSTAITPADCTQPPFNQSYLVVLCSDGQTASGGANQDPDQLCQSQGHGLSQQSVNNIADGVQTVADAADNAAKGAQAAADAAIAAARNANAKTCGEGDQAVKITIDVGCRGVGNPIVDMLYAFVRFLSLGVGVVLVASTIVAGIQYTASSGDPTALSKSKARIASNLGALVLFLLTYAILNWLIPGGLFP